MWESKYAFVKYFRRVDNKKVGNVIAAKWNNIRNHITE